MKTVKPTNSSPWNKGKLVGQKSPLRLRDMWGIGIRVELAAKVRDLALFDMAIDSKLRACDLTKLRVRDVAHGTHVSSRAIVMQQNMREAARRRGSCPGSSPRPIKPRTTSRLFVLSKRHLDTEKWCTLLSGHHCPDG